MDRKLLDDWIKRLGGEWFTPRGLGSGYGSCKMPEVRWPTPKRCSRPSLDCGAPKTHNLRPHPTGRRSYCHYCRAQWR